MSMMFQGLSGGVPVKRAAGAARCAPVSRTLEVLQELQPLLGAGQPAPLVGAFLAGAPRMSARAASVRERERALGEGPEEREATRRCATGRARFPRCVGRFQGSHSVFKNL